MPSDLSQLLEPGEPVRVATGFVFTEGPLWHPDGFLYVSDVDSRVHYRVSLPDGNRSVIRTDSGGANGSTFDIRGRLVTCEQDARRVVRTEADGSIVVIVDHYRGARLNRSNDIVGRSDGSLYFTDPERLMPEPEREIGASAILRVSPDGELQLVAKDMNHPNGIAFSPDEAMLYVSNSRPDPHLHVYDVLPDGSLVNSREFAEMRYQRAARGATFRAPSGQIRPAAEQGGVPDGLKVDVEGRVYCTGPGGTWVWEANGTHLGVIQTPELPANLAWGDADRRTLFLTCRTSVYRLRAKTPGTTIPGEPAAAV